MPPQRAQHNTPSSVRQRRQADARDRITRPSLSISVRTLAHRKPASQKDGRSSSAEMSADRHMCVHTHTYTHTCKRHPQRECFTLDTDRFLRCPPPVVLPLLFPLVPSETHRHTCAHVCVRIHT
eukprot:GHVU01207856.1.p2 GENE.GHVU01207856.1~~GHVU01207856.1.p2  ORF type:complete len:124 (-),score=2.87 GHVU01207856.1:303-674(-)